MNGDLPKGWWIASYLLESLHRAGFTVSACNGKVMLTPESEVGPALRAEVDRHHDALLKMLEAEEAFARAMKGSPDV
jgi:hypothetical protein